MFRVPLFFRFLVSRETRCFSKDFFLNNNDNNSSSNGGIFRSSEYILRIYDRSAQLYFLDTNITNGSTNGLRFLEDFVFGYKKGSKNKWGNLISRYNSRPIFQTKKRRKRLLYFQKVVEHRSKVFQNFYP